MKMKKTQSLKLMLLGLLALGSTSASAKVGDIFADGKLICKEVAGGAQVLGYASVMNNGKTVVIPDKVYNDFDEDKELSIIDISDTWYKGGFIAYVVDNVIQAQGATTPTLTDYNFILKIEAKSLENIRTDAIQPLNGNITQFIVTQDAGLKGIPAFAFANVPTKEIDNTGSQEYIDAKEKYEALKALVDGSVEDYTIPVVVKGAYDLDGDYKGKQVYRLLYDNTDQKYADDVIVYGILSDVAGNATGSFQIFRVNKNGSVTKNFGEGVLQTSGTNNGKIMRKVNNKNTVVAVPLVEGDADYAAWGAKKMKGLKTQAEEAEAAWRNLVQIRNNFLGVNLATCDYKTKKKSYEIAKLDYETQKATDDALNAIWPTWSTASNELKAAVKSPTPENLAKLTEQSDIDDYEFIVETLFQAHYAQNTQDPVGYDIQDYGTVHSQTLAKRDAMNKAYDEWKALIAYEDNKTKAQYTNHNGVLTPVKDGTVQKKGMTLEQLEAAIDAAETLMETTAAAYDLVNDADPTLLQELENDMNAKATKKVPETDPKKFKNNEVLTKVQIDNGKIETWGESAFVNCIGVATEDWTAGTTSFTFPAATKTIGANAFRNTHINAKLGSCAANLEKIDNYAFMGTETEYVNLNNGTQITNDMIGKGVWDNTPLKSIGLKNTALTLMPNGLAQNIRRAKTLVEGCEAEGFYVQANTTLESVALPLGLTKIADKQFVWCLNLATITTGIPATVTSIGKEAFRGTAIPKFDLTALTELTKVGDLAFANNSALLSVKFAPEAPFTNLEGSTFECDNNLNELVINDDLECLPAGILKGTSLKKLDLSNSQITVLNNLFEATVDEPNETLVELTLPETLLADDNYTVLRPGLKVIADKALSQLKALKGTKQADDSYRMIIPSSVELMGSFVFQNDKALENVDFINTKLVSLGEGTFNSTDALTEVKFISVNRVVRTDKKMGTVPEIEGLNDCSDNLAGIIDANKYFGFVEGKVFGKVGRNPQPTVWVTKESYELLKTDGGIKEPLYEDLYTELKYIEQSIPVIGPNKINGQDTYVAVYYNPDYGTWIPTQAEKQDGATVKVWTAYQDGDNIYAYGAKHNNKFYKIPAAGDPKTSKYFKEYVDGEGARMFDPGDGDDNIDGGGADDLVPTETSDDVMTGDNYNYVTPTTSEMKAFAKQTTNGTYVFKADQYYAPGSAAVIITTDKNQPVKFEQHSTQNTKYQSTLDYKNELKVAGCPIPSTDDDDVYKFTGKGGKWIFYQDVRLIPAKKIVFPMSAYQGTAYPDKARDIIFLDGEFTSIDEVKQYVKAMNESGEIYNLRGMKVATPVKGQMYIQNGKKFIQK